MPRLPIMSALLPLALLAGCATASGGGRALSPGVPAVLSAGESVTLPDASVLTYVGVSSDSRCPPNVQCIQAGSAVLAFRHAMHDVTLETGKSPSANLGMWTLTLVALDFSSPPKATVRIDAAR